MRGAKGGLIGQVIVVGAGIAGLTSAIALRQAGIDVTVLEQREAWRTHGGVGMTLMGNAMAAQPVEARRFARSRTGAFRAHAPWSKIA